MFHLIKGNQFSISDTFNFCLEDMTTIFVKQIGVVLLGVQTQHLVYLDCLTLCYNWCDFTTDSDSNR